MRTCVAIAEEDVPRALTSCREAEANGADMIEVRFDAMTTLPEDLDVFSELKVPLIATLRSKAQGGFWTGPDDLKIHFLQKAARSGFAYVDLENDFPLLNEAPQLLKGVKIIVSHHDFHATPKTSVIIETMVSMSSHGDAVKVACQAQSMGDVLRLCEAARAFSFTGHEFAAISMGERGSVSRALHERLGSSFTYASLRTGKEVAPGQIDLASMKRLTGDIIVTGVCGQSLSHSLSPWMHNAAYQDLNIPGRYFKFQAEKEELPDLLELMGLLDVRGSNITIPHKETIIQHLDSIDPEAERIGAVNTVLNDSGEFKGFNTDVFGVEMTFKLANVEAKGKRALVMGAGGAARSVCAYLSKAGADIVLANRTADKAKHLAQRFDGIEVIEQPNVASHDYDILVNCTPLGMKGYPDALSIPVEVMRKGQFVMDTIYNPSRTRLVSEAEARGANAVSGRDMLIFQAMKAFEIWTKVLPRYEVMAKGFDEGMSR